jgi:PAS domain S-box-containing protein
MKTLFQMLDKAADSAFVIDKDQHIIYWNQSAQKLLGYSADEVIGQPCYKVLRGCDNKGNIICGYHCNTFTGALTSQTVPSYDLATRTKSGEMRWINISILTFSSGHDSTPVIIHLFRDATQTKQNEQFIQQLFDAVEQGQQFRSSVMSQPELNIKALTKREREVLSLLAQGHSTLDISQLLSISSSTVRNHIQSIFDKLNVHSRLEAVTYALEHGLASRE